MRRTVLVALCLTFVFVPWAVTRADPPVVEPYDAYLPDPKWTESDPSSDAPMRHHAALIVDDVTGEPIEGAWFQGFDEDIGAGTVEYAALLRESRSNADGIAWVPGFDEMEIDHWLIKARGYAPAYHFGYQPPAVVRMVRGATTRGRIADVHGRPVAGLPIDVFCGCPHGPVYARLETDREGRFLLPPFHPDVVTQLWFVTPRGASEMVSVESIAYNDARGMSTLLRAGRTVRGRIVAATGAGMPDVAVRAYGGAAPEPGEDPGFVRGPGTRTGADGRFVLHGLDGRQESVGLLVTPPGEEWPIHWRVPDVPSPSLTLRLPLAEEPEDEEERGWLVLRARHPDGGALPRMPDLLGAREDGLVEDRLAATPGFENELPPGHWVVTPKSAFLATTFEPFAVDIVAGETVEREVVVTQQPRTALLGVSDPLPSLGQFTLATDSEEMSVTVGELQDGSVSVPATGDVSLDVDGHVFLFGPVTNGRRRVAVTLPKPHVVRLVAPFEVDSAMLVAGGIEVDWPDVEENRFETDCRGTFVAVVEDHEGDGWRVPLVLTGEPREQIVDVVAVGAEPVRSKPLRLSWRFPDGSVPEDVYLVARRIAGTTDSIRVSGAASPEDELEAPCHVRLTAPGVQPLEADLEPGDRELVWGPHILTLEAFAPDGSRVQSVVMVDGELHRDFGDEPFRLRGLEPGKHRVIVTPFDLRWRGVVMTLDLTAVETKHVVRFTLR